MTRTFSTRFKTSSLILHFFLDEKTKQKNQVEVRQLLRTVRSQRSMLIASQCNSAFSLIIAELRQFGTQIYSGLIRNDKTLNAIQSAIGGATDLSKKSLKIKVAAGDLDKKLFEPPFRGEFFLSVDEGTVVFSYDFLGSLDLLVLLHQGKRTET